MARVQQRPAALLDRNLYAIPASEISEAQVVATIFTGRTVFE